ncbi:MAG: hypothetical protein AAF251_05160 [Pseudomonadota bacterium]
MSAKDDSDLGPWEGDDLETSAKDVVGSGADAGLPEEIRFRSTIAKLVRRRLAVCNNEDQTPSLAIFLLEPSPPETASAYDPRRVPMLDTGRHDLGGRIWFVGAGPGSGHWIAANFDDDDEQVRFVTDALRLGDTPAIIFDPEHPEAHIQHYPNGLDQLEVFKDVSVASTEISIAAVSDIIENTHSEKMITPKAQPETMRLWADSKKWWPVKNAEAKIRDYLLVALNAAFPTCTVREEQDVISGRLDIEIVESDPVDRTRVSQHGVLELKVLRSFGETGRSKDGKETRDWVKSGVEQAASYRNDRGAAWGALICFDMRKEDEGDNACFGHVLSIAKTLNVHLKRWFLFGRYKDYRSAVATAGC